MPATPTPATSAVVASSLPTSSTAVDTAVVDQVMNAVPKMLQRGDGTSRLTLRLHPADLGEVHVTVAVKGDSCNVTLAADERARAALGAGSERLRSLLAGLGHTSGEVVVRELAAGAGSVSSQPGQTGGQGAGQQPPSSDPSLTGDLTGRQGGRGDGDPTQARRSGTASDAGGRASALPGQDGTTPRRQRLGGRSGVDVTV
jgi:flagellar hook-length control protein FliK